VAACGTERVNREGVVLQSANQSAFSMRTQALQHVAWRGERRTLARLGCLLPGLGSASAPPPRNQRWPQPMCVHLSLSASSLCARIPRSQLSILTHSRTNPPAFAEMISHSVDCSTVAIKSRVTYGLFHNGDTTLDLIDGTSLEISVDFSCYKKEKKIGWCSS